MCLPLWSFVGLKHLTCARGIYCSPFLLPYACLHIALDISLNASLTCSITRFWLLVSIFSLRCFRNNLLYSLVSSLTHRFFISKTIPMCFFPSFYLGQVSIFKTLWPKKIVDMISSLLILCRSALWPSMCPNLSKVPHFLQWIVNRQKYVIISFLLLSLMDFLNSPTRLSGHMPSFRDEKTNVFNFWDLEKFHWTSTTENKSQKPAMNQGILSNKAVEKEILPGTIMYFEQIWA